MWSTENPPTGEPLTPAGATGPLVPAGDRDNHPTGATGPLVPAGDRDDHPMGASGPLVPAGGWCH